MDFVAPIVFLISLWDCFYFAFRVLIMLWVTGNVMLPWSQLQSQIPYYTQVLREVRFLQCEHYASEN